MKRVLIFSLAYIPFVGGAELALKQITDRIAPSEYSFDLITLRFDPSLPAMEKLGNLTVHRIGWSAPGAKISDRSMPLRCKAAKYLFPFTAYLKARSLHNVRPYDLVWALMANQAAFGALFFKRSYPSVPYVLELQDGNTLRQVRERRPVTRILWPLYRDIYRKADRVKAISRFIEKLAREAGYRGPLEVIPNGVDIEKFSRTYAPEILADVRRQTGKREGDVFLFTASRLVLSRGVEDIIRALPLLHANVKLLVAGDGEDRSKLETIAKDAGVRERVIFLGHIAHDALPKYLAVSDIFVRPSIVEGMGSAFIEAFAAGVPVVATDVGGIPDFLTPGVTGLFCNVRDPRSVAEAVKKYLEDPGLQERIRLAAKSLAREQYDWSRISREQEKFFDSATSSVSGLSIRG